MNLLRFAIPSEQLELLLAFEERKGLAQLAETLGRDPSVVSRGLQRLAEDYPVLTKVKGKWEITPLGLRINESSRAFINDQRALVALVEPKVNSNRLSPDPKTTLIIINAQQGLLDATQEGRNNSEAERNIEKLINVWRNKGLPIVHVKHVSESPTSTYFRASASCEFLPNLSPMGTETVIEKEKASGFQGTSLEQTLDSIGTERVVLAGFTANECIDSTARDATALGFTTYVIGDATAMFDIRTNEGKLLKAERIHKLTLANLAAFHAIVLRTSDVV